MIPSYSLFMSCDIRIVLCYVFIDWSKYNGIPNEKWAHEYLLKPFGMFLKFTNQNINNTRGAPH